MTVMATATQPATWTHIVTATPPEQSSAQVSAPFPPQSWKSQHRNNSTSGPSDFDNEESMGKHLKGSEDLPISPSEDVKSYGKLIKRIAAKLGLRYSTPKMYIDYVVFDVVQKDILPAVTLPLMSVICRLYSLPGITLLLCLSHQSNLTTCTISKRLQQASYILTHSQTL